VVTPPPLKDHNFVSEDFVDHSLILTLSTSFATKMRPVCTTKKHRAVGNFLLLNIGCNSNAAYYS
jgi:hypothetical protein